MTRHEATDRFPQHRIHPDRWSGVRVLRTNESGRASDVFGTAVIVILVATAIVTIFLSDRDAAAIAGTAALFLGHVTAGTLMLRRARHLPDDERRPWLVIGTGLLSAAVGLIVVAAQGDSAPVFGLADIFYLTAYVLVLVALALFVRMDPGGHPLGLTMLDVTVGAVAAAALVWDVVLEDLVHTEVDTWQQVGLSLYPILDVASVVGLCVVALRRSHYRFDLRLMLVAAGMLLQVGGDMTYLRDAVAVGLHTATEPHFWLFLLASAAFVGAALIAARSPAKKQFPDREAPLWALVWPYLLASSLIPLHVFRVEQLLAGSTPDDLTGERVILYALLLVGVLVVTRQILAIRFNRTRIERQRRELISSVSHELRTPLTAVLGFLQVLEDDPEAFTSEEQESMRREISVQANHMARTVTDLISLARDGGATMLVRRAETSLADMVASAKEAAFGFPLTTDVDDHILEVDSDRLQQAIGHLITNAAQYGGEKAHLRAAVRGGTLTIEVHDDGPGVPTKHVSAVWNQFDRGARRLDSNTPGLGIGLALVRAVAAAHGGKAEYRRSELLGGSCFNIAIPAAVRGWAPIGSPAISAR